MSNTAMYRGRFVHSHKNKSLRAHPIHDPFDKKLLATHRREVARILNTAAIEVERRLEPRLTPPSGLTDAEYTARKEQLEKHRPTGRVNPIRLFGEFESTHVDFKRN